jgi:probable F420-dependent oxidoreductase
MTAAQPEGGVRWGVTVPLEGLSLAGHRAVVEELGGLGFADVWSSESSGADAFTPLALAAAWAPELRLGTAVVPVFTRGPGLLAMTAAAMAEAAPGRFALGIGASSPVVVEHWNGVPFERPWQRTRDTLRFLRRALAGERVDQDYETFAVRGFRLARAPEVPPRLLVAALRPGMLRLAGREADGVILNWLAAADVPTATAELGSAARGTGTEVAARIFVCPTGDAAAARRLGRRLISTYLTVPVYAAFHRWLGRGELLEPMWSAWAAGDRRAANAAIPDQVVDDLFVHGTPEQCRAHLRRYVDAGVTTPILALVPPDPSAGADEGEEVWRQRLCGYLRELAPRR